MADYFNLFAVVAVAAVAPSFVYFQSLVLLWLWLTHYLLHSDGIFIAYIFDTTSSYKITSQAQRTQSQLDNIHYTKSSQSTWKIFTCSRDSSRLMSIQSFRSTLFLMRYDRYLSSANFSRNLSFRSNRYLLNMDNPNKNQSTVSKLYSISSGLIWFSLFRQNANVGRRTRYLRMSNSEWPSEPRTHLIFVCLWTTIYWRDACLCKCQAVCRR